MHLPAPGIHSKGFLAFYWKGYTFLSVVSLPYRTPYINVCPVTLTNSCGNIPYSTHQDLHVVVWWAGDCKLVTMIGHTAPFIPLRITAVESIPVQVGSGAAWNQFASSSPLGGGGATANCIRKHYGNIFVLGMPLVLKRKCHCALVVLLIFRDVKNYG